MTVLMPDRMGLQVEMTTAELMAVETELIHRRAERQLTKAEGLRLAAVEREIDRRWYLVG
jgi:hypothetical protein